MTKMTIIVLVEIEEEEWFDDDDSKEWFISDILDRETLILYSNECGDSVGKVVKVGVVV